jgi:type I restriction enzyme M protein
VWVYDLRANMPAFGKRPPLTHDHFAEFEKCYGKKSDGTSKRADQGEDGRFRCFPRQQIAKRDDNLDISWLKDEDGQSFDDLPEPDEIATRIRDRLQAALEEIDALSGVLECEERDV